MPDNSATLPNKPISIGIVGLGGRGRSVLARTLAIDPHVKVPAVCDYRKDRAAAGAAMIKKLRGNDPEVYDQDEHHYLKMLERDDLDAVLVTTDIYWTGRIAVDALKAGKHAGHEVPGCYSLEECRELVEAHEKTGRHCMLLENCCYARETLTLYNMIRKGLLGEPYFATGSYIHEVRNMFFEGNGSLTWRGKLCAEDYGCSYNSHALGSPSKWLGINDGDRFAYCACTMTEPRETHLYAVEKFGKDSPAAKVDFKTGDFVTTLLETAKGKQIRIDYSITSERPYSRYYLVQGMNGCYDSRAGIYVEGQGTQHAWRKLDEFMAEWEHPFWKNDGAEAQRIGGHGGYDYFCEREFIKMVRTGEPPWIDAYDSAAWSSILEVSRQSIDAGGKRVEVPDFTGGKWKSETWREGRMV
jgi:predicted dehydrogenase